MRVWVISPFTEADDRGLKFRMNQSLASLREYLLIASERVHADRFVRQAANQWRLTSVDKVEAAIHLESVDFDLRLAGVYEKVEFIYAPPHMRRLDH